MTSKEYMISTLHKLYRSDVWLNELYGAVGKILDDDITDQITDDYDNLFFTSLTQVGVEMFEKDLNIIAGRSQTLEQRRKVIQSKWLAKQFASLPVIQSIADSYYDGDVTATYDGNAMLTYVVRHYLPNTLPNTTAFQNATGEIKPAHIGERFVYKNNVWKDYYYPLIWQTENDRLWSALKPERWEDQGGNVHTWTYCSNRTWSEMMTKDID